ncbi:MAG: class I SAM-dependent DNA methyltransferase [Terrimicrobiaceae bacterium]|nr:class I SAM-dependent DNA methyltransferase [Terrimicrobiaceae bacterium]
MDQALRSKLDRITNILFAGGVNNPVTYIEQLSYLIFLKLLDERESDIQRERKMMGDAARSRSLFPEQASRYRWTEWRFKSGNELRAFLRDEVFPYMASLVQEEPQVAIYFQDARLEVDDANVLKQVVDELDSIQFGKLGTDVKGDIYEYLLQYLATQEGALLGQFRTPRQVRLAMVEMLNPDLGDTIFDPACGTGGFLIDSVEYILAKYSDRIYETPIYGEEWLEKKGLTLEQARTQMPRLQTWRKGAGEKIPDWELLERSIFGIEVSRQMMRISMMNLVLHGIRNAHVKRANALSEMGGLTDEDLRRRYRVILSNPPFAGVLPKESIRKDLPTQSKKSELLFLGVVMESLAPGGRAAVIVPEGLLFGSSTGHVELRRKLCEDFELLAVISLTSGVFKPYAGVKTAILIFRKPVAEQKRTDLAKVWFYEVKNDGFDPDKIIGGGRVQTPEKNDLPSMLQKWAEFKGTGFVTPPGIETGTLLPSDAPEPQSWWASTATIADNDFNLGAGRYKPRVAEATPEDDPIDLIRKTLGNEQAISSDLEKLLADLENAQ